MQVEERKTVFAETVNGDLAPYAIHIIGMGLFSSSDACLNDGKSWTRFMFFWINTRSSHVKVVINSLFLQNVVNFLD